MQEYLADKFNLPPGGITASIADETLKPKGFKRPILDEVKRFFTACDIARFTPSRYEKKDMAALLRDAERIVEYFKKA